MTKPVCEGELRNAYGSTPCTHKATYQGADGKWYCGYHKKQGQPQPAEVSHSQEKK